MSDVVAGSPRSDGRRTARLAARTDAPAGATGTARRTASALALALLLGGTCLARHPALAADPPVPPGPTAPATSPEGDGASRSRTGIAAPLGEPHVRVGLDVSNAARTLPFAHVGFGFQRERLGARAGLGILFTGSRLSAELTWALDARRRTHLVLGGGREGAGLQDYDYSYDFVAVGLERRLGRLFAQLSLTAGRLGRSDIQDGSAPAGSDDTDGRVAAALTIGFNTLRRR